MFSVNISRVLHNFVTSGISGDYTSEAVRKTLIINIFSLIGLLFIIVFGIRELSNHQIFFGLLDFIFALIFIGNLVFLWITKNFKFAGWISVILLSLFILILLIFGKDTNKSLWYFVFPLVSYFVLGTKNGGIVNLILFLITILLFFFPTGPMPDYDNSFIARFSSVYLAVTGLAHTFEIIRHKTYQSLYEANNKISEILNHTIQQKEEIKSQAEQLELVNQELKKLSAVVSETHNAVMIMKRSGEVEWVNDAFTNLYGYNIFTINESYNQNLIDAAFNNKLQEKTDQVQKNEMPTNFESTVIAQSGKEIEVQTTLTPLFDERGRISKFIIIDTDISHQKEVERKLKEMVAMKDKFFSIIAHDLKNPFNSILGVSKLLAENPDKYDRDKMNYFHKSLYEVSKKSYDLLINLLDWSRAQTGRIEVQPQPLNLFLTVKDTIQLVQSFAGEKGVRLKNSIDANCEVMADFNTLRTILRNLITNGIKYSFKGGIVKIKASRLDGKAKVDVTDQGIGISKEDQKKLFRIDEHYSKKGTEQESGTGLGLILCKEFVEKNGGEIFVESEKGRGSTFSFTLPLPNHG